MTPPTRDDLEFWKFFQKWASSLVKTLDIKLAIAMWLIPGMSALNKFGLNANVWTSEVTVWDKWWMYEWIETASVLDISSTSGNDTSAWTWARTMYVQWLDANYNEIAEVVTLDWWNIVNTTNSFYRVHRMSIMTAWDSGWAEWIITANIWATTYAQVDNWNNQTLMSLYTIPAWKTWYLTYWKSATWVWKDATVYFKVRPIGWVFNVWHVAYLVENSYEYEFNPPMVIPEKADVVVTAKSWQASTSISAVFDLILVDND